MTSKPTSNLNRIRGGNVAISTQTPERRALEWLLSRDTGTSSKSICAHMLGVEKTDAFGMMAPSDSADRGRCIRLLDKIPEWWDRLDEMAEYPSREYISFTSKGQTVRSDGWKEQIPLIFQEAEKVRAYSALNNGSGNTTPPMPSPDLGEGKEK